MKKLSKKKPKSDRPSWDQYFMAITEIVGSRSTCDRGRSGAVIVKNKHILTTGYVGSPIGHPHCDEVGHEMHKVTLEDGTESEHCIRTTHAEQNAIIQATRIGISIDGATLYCKMVPCYTCAKLIINSGIKRVVAMKEYHVSKQTHRVFKQSKVELVTHSTETETYDNM